MAIAQNTNSDLPNEIAIFLDSCLWDKGIKDVPEELKKQMIADLASRLNGWLITAAMNYLNEHSAKALDTFLETQPDQATTVAFLRTKIPNLDSIFSQAMLEFKQAYVKG